MRASTRGKLSSGVCKQQKRRTACASAQSNQRLSCSLIRRYHIKACSKRNYTILARLCSLAGWFRYDKIGNPEDRLCRDDASYYVRQYTMYVCSKLVKLYWVCMCRLFPKRRIIVLNLKPVQFCTGLIFCTFPASVTANQTITTI